MENSKEKIRYLEGCSRKSYIQIIGVSKGEDWKE